MWPFNLKLNLTNKEPLIVNKNWRIGMWVMYKNATIGILHKLGETFEVHLVNKTTGETKEVVVALPTELKQANFEDIPQCRKIGMTAEQGKALGYGS